MTSNRPIEDWGKLMGNAPSATAILDRFLHHATLIPMNGRSYRLKDAPATADKPPSAAKPDENARKTQKGSI